MVAVTGVSNADVSIDNIESISTARRGLNISIPMRRLLAEGVRIDMSIKVADKTAADAMHAKLTVTAINTKLQESGLPAVTILEAPKSVASQDGAVNTDGNADSVQEEDTFAKKAGQELILGIVGAVGGAIGMAFLGYIYKRLGMRQPAETPGNTQMIERPPAQNVPAVSANLAYAPTRGTQV